MNKKSIHIAYAVNTAGRFEEKHFGKADKYMIYEWNNNEFLFIKEEINTFKNLYEDQVNVSNDNCGLITDLLQKCDVKVLVSRQFGRNVQMVNRFFIPVIVNSETPDEVGSILTKHIRWIEDELHNKTEEFKLFSIKKGIMKTDIRHDNQGQKLS